MWTNYVKSEILKDASNMGLADIHAINPKFVCRSVKLYFPSAETDDLILDAPSQLPFVERLVATSSNLFCCYDFHRENSFVERRLDRIESM